MAVPVAVAGTDVTINEEDLPQVVPFDGSGSLADPGRTIVGYLWEVLFQSPESSAALLNAETATPSLDSADVWWNTRIYLRVKDSAHYWSCWAPISGMAQAVPAPGTAWDAPPSGWRLVSHLEAPDSAFVHVRVLSYELGLEKLAEGERNFTLRIDAWVNALDMLDAWQATHVISDHQDTEATGADLDILTQGGDATGMHTHPGADVARATAAARGGLLLAEAPVDPLNPKAANVVRFALCGNTEPTALVAAPLGTAEILTWSGPDPAVEASFAVIGMSFSMRDGGTVAGGGYRFGLYNMATGVLLGDTGIVIPTGDNNPIKKSIAITPLTVISDAMFGVRVTSAPAGSPDQGAGLSVVLWCQRAY